MAKVKSALTVFFLTMWILTREGSAESRLNDTIPMIESVACSFSSDPSLHVRRASGIPAAFHLDTAFSFPAQISISGTGLCAVNYSAAQFGYSGPAGFRRIIQTDLPNN